MLNFAKIPSWWVIPYSRMSTASIMSYPSYINPQAVTMFNMSTLLNQKDSRWLQLEVCREYQRQKCTRSDCECKFAHPPPNVEVQNGRVTACYDSIKVRNFIKLYSSNPRWIFYENLSLSDWTFLTFDRDKFFLNIDVVNEWYHCIAVNGEKSKIWKIFTCESDTIYI